MHWAGGLRKKLVEIPRHGFKSPALNGRLASMRRWMELRMEEKRRFFWRRLHRPTGSKAGRWCFVSFLDPLHARSNASNGDVEKRTLRRKEQEKVSLCKRRRCVDLLVQKKREDFFHFAPYLENIVTFISWRRRNRSRKRSPFSV